MHSPSSCFLWVPIGSFCKASWESSRNTTVAADRGSVPCAFWQWISTVHNALNKIGMRERASCAPLPHHSVTVSGLQGLKLTWGSNSYLTDKLVSGESQKRMTSTCFGCLRVVLSLYVLHPFGPASATVIRLYQWRVLAILFIEYPIWLYPITSQPKWRALITPV